MAVEQLGGITHRVRGDGALSLQIELPAGLRGEDYLEIEAGEQLEPEGQVLVHIQTEGDADPAPGAVPAALAMEGAKLCIFIPHQVGMPGGLLAQGAGAAVARDEPPPAVKGIDCEGAVVGAQAAGGRLGGVGELLQGLRREQSALLQVQVPGGQGCAEGAHDARDGGAGDVPAQLQLKGPEYRVVVEGAALDHDMLPKIVGGGGTNDLVNGVFYDGDGKTGRDVLHAGSVLLSLLDAGVHKYGAAGAQVYRVLSEQAQLGEVCDGIAQGLGEGLDEGAAAGGAGLVEHDGVHRLVADLEALHVLAADVDDKIHLRRAVGGRPVMGHCFHQPQVTGEGVFDQGLAVAGDRRPPDLDAAAAHGVDGPQLLQHDGHRVALVGVVIGVQEAAILCDEGQLGGGGAGVNAQPGGAAVGLDVGLGRALGVVSGADGAVFAHITEQRGHGVHQGGGVYALLQLFQRVLKENGGIVGGAQGGTHSGEAVAILGEDGVVLVQLQGLHKPLPQAHEEVEGAAQKDDPTLQLPALGEAGHRLVHHRLENGGGHVLLPPALVQDGLDVAFGKHTAAGGDRIDLFMLQGEGV